MENTQDIFSVVSGYFNKKIDNFLIPKAWVNRPNGGLPFYIGKMDFEDSDDEDPLYVMFGVAEKAVIIPIIMTDGDPEEIGLTILNILTESAKGIVFDTLHTIRLTDSDYLAKKNVYGLIFLLPSTLDYFSEVEDCIFEAEEHRKILMMTFISKEEYDIAIQDRMKLLDYFEEIDRDLLSIFPQSVKRE